MIWRSSQINQFSGYHSSSSTRRRAFPIVSTAPRDPLICAHPVMPGFTSQRRVAVDLPAQAFEDVPFLPLGQFFQPTAWSRSLTGSLQGMPLFWNIRRG